MIYLKCFIDHQINNQHGIIIKCLSQLIRDITATAATVTLCEDQAAAIAKARGRHSEYGRLSNIEQAPLRQHAGTTCHGTRRVDDTAPARGQNNS